MATRIVHISDLHFAAADSEQPMALAQSIADAKPDVIVQTGDLTRRGRRREYRAAAAFLASLPGPKLIVPGNHDVPVPGLMDRMFRPFARFAEHFPDQPALFETSDAVLITLNTTVGMRLSAWDWSLGDAHADRVGPVAALLKGQRKGRVAIVACHHPLLPHVLDVRRSATRRGPQAFAELAEAGMQVLLHGHLHRASCVCLDLNGVEVCEVCANTALSDRERGGAAGFNILDVVGGTWTLTVARWQNRRYQLSAADSE
jgi:3',5'-cyclic AMP phosphodiesterase CpdA